MAVAVGVHGIAQQLSGPARQLRKWTDSFNLGMKYANCAPADAPSLAVPFYGKLFSPGSPYLGDDNQREWDDEEVDFVRAALEEFTAGISEPELDELERSGRTLGAPALLPPPLLRGLAAIDRRWGTGRAVILIGVLRQVNAYLFVPGAGDEIREIVIDAITDDTRVLLGHSLGSVIAYDVLLRAAVPQIDTLVTLGSPLPLATIQSALPIPSRALPGNDVPWINVHDPWDPVTVGLGMAPQAHDISVSNPKGDPHALSAYLGRKETAAAVLAAVR